MSGHLERQRALLSEALAIVADDGLRAQLLAEEQRLSSAAPRDVTDRAFELAVVAYLAPLRLPDGPAALLAALAGHPALVALGQAPAVTAAGAAAVIQVAQGQPGQARRLGLGDVAALRAAAGGDAAFQELTGILHARWLATADEERPYLERDVAVMLPVGIETLFKQAGAGWELWLRVVPDEASIRRDVPTASPVEVRLLAAMWQEIHDRLGDAERARPIEEWLETDPGRLAWETFCGRVGNGRAAWLAGACAESLVDGVVSVDAADVASGARPNRVGGFPPRLEVWAAFGDDEPTRLDAFDVAVDALVFDVIGARPAGPATTELVHEKDRWWVSWPVAQSVGLGRVIPFPAGRAPADLRTLFVVGLGEDGPAEHFRGKIDAGELAAIPLGAATNSVDGAPAAPLGHDSGAWRAVARRRILQRRLGVAEEDELSRSLGGVGAALPAMPVPPSIPNLDQALVWALWPVLWGHQLRDLWGCVEEADHLASWAQRHLRPEGPLPPLRIDDQPYGLLPTSALSRWSVAAEEGSAAGLEARLQPSLLAMRSHWAAAARKRGNAVGADTERLLALISRDAASARYAYRTFLASPLWAALYASTGTLSQAALDGWIRDTFRPVYDIVRRGPDEPPGIRQLIAGGGYRELTIPLVVPDHWPLALYEQDGPNLRLDEHGNPILRSSVERSFAELLDTLRRYGHRYDLAYERWRGVLPDSLLVRLLLHAGVLSAAAVAQVNGGAPAPLREPLVGDTAVPTVLEQLAQAYDPGMPHDHPAGLVRRMVVDGLTRLLKAIGDQPPEAGALPQLERAFRATLDTAMHRVDPWIVGLSARRLEYLRDRPETRFRLAVYGWVDGPIRGAAGPTEAGLLHAPSHAQALTGAILRDKEISERLEVPPPPGERDRWSIQLESHRLRLAEELAEEVRLGCHVFEALGRRVEQVIGVRTPVGPVVEATHRVDVLRRTFPAKAGQPDRGRVCHGVDALAGLLGTGPVPLAITAGQRAELELLGQVLDAYGDLLVAEAVHQVVTGHADRAGASMDAAAGLAAPPSFEFSETPLAGDGTTTAVLGVVPYVAPPAAPDAAHSPARLADASVAAALEGLVGAASSWTWEVAGGDGALRTGTLADLGLEPADTLALSSDLLDDLARAWLEVADGTPLGGNGRRRHLLARDLSRALGSQPAFLRDVASPAATPQQAEQRRARDASSLEELRSRYHVLRESALLVIGELAAARAAADPGLLRQALMRALRWGVRPLAGRDQLRVAYAALVRDVAAPAQLLLTLAQRAEESLRERLSAAPPVGTTDPLGSAIAELAAPEGQLAVLGRASASSLVEASGLHVDAADATLDAEWLTIVAAVRPRLATVEALQLEALPTTAPGVRFAGFASWSSAPGDPWQTAALAALRQRRLQPGGNDPRLVLPRLVAAFTVGDVWRGAGADPAVAVGLVDAWSEAVPRAAQRTTAAFGFNAPGARPPQAILLAVPPDLGAAFGARLEAATLIQILEETRELAHARAVDAEDIGAYLAAVPTATLGATGRTGVRLDPATTFPG